MMWGHLEAVTQIAVGYVLNSLPEGLVIAAFAWMMLRFLPRQNSGTRFAVWFAALLGVAGLPLIDAVAAGHFVASGVVRPMISVPLISIPGRWGVVAFGAWMLAASIAVLRLAAGLWRLRELRRSCIAIDKVDLDPAVFRTVTDFNTSRSVTLTTSEHVSVPAVLGFFKPIIVIPPWALRELPPDELSVILLHELAHLRRRDDWSNLLQKIVRAVFIFHPAVWWIESRLSLEREMACDDAVLAETANPRGYAKCLVALMEKSSVRRGLAMAQAAVRRGREASLRLAQILDAGRPNTKHVWKPALGLVGAFSVLCLMIAPRAPEFVAFEQNPAIHSGDVQGASRVESRFPSAAAIPAGLRSSSSSSLAPISHSAAAKVVEHRHASPQLLPARLHGETKRNPVRIVTAGKQKMMAPGSEALFLIRTTQRLGPDSWVWSVSVWQVIVISPAQDGTEGVPIAHKT